MERRGKNHRRDRLSKPPNSPTRPESSQDRGSSLWGKVITTAESFIPQIGKTRRRRKRYLPKSENSGKEKLLDMLPQEGTVVSLTNRSVSELPHNPDCPILVELFLDMNEDLARIPFRFFDNMPSLRRLDLSGTGIRCLPSSICKLTTLQELFLRECAFLMELPPEIGGLKNLKVFDSEGTMLMSLPKEVGSLMKLERLKVSLYHQPNDQTKRRVPVAALAKLKRLKEVSIYLEAYIEWWEDEVKSIINVLRKVRNLEILSLYFPTKQVLEMFMETQHKRGRGISIYQQLSNFHFVVGHLEERVISRTPRDLVKRFMKLPKCVVYTDDEGDTQVVSRVLKDANAFMLEQHWSVRALSDFGLAEMEKIKSCLLAECNELLEIVNESHLKDHSPRPVLGSLEHLWVYFMKNLTCILSGTIDSGVACLSNLKTLAIHACPQLMTVLTQGLLDGLTCLEDLVVVECAMIDSLVSLEAREYSTPCLPSLKKLSLLHLRKLVSISRGIRIAPRLQSLVVYDCPNLKELCYMEAFNDLTEIRGLQEWWDGLTWCEPEWTSGRPEYLSKIFKPLAADDDDELFDELDAAMTVPLL